MSFSPRSALFLSLPAALLAASAQPGDPVVLDPVVVTTVHPRQQLIVTLDPRASAQPVPAQDGADVLKQVPGFSVIRKGGADGDPVFRGMAGSRLGVQIDGESIHGGCGNRMDPPTAYVFPSAYDRVTIIKGPQSVAHGPGHSAGLVRFERADRRFDRREASLFSSVMSGGFQRFDAAIDARAGTPLVQARTAITRNSAGNYRDGDGREIHSRYRRWSANAAVAWTPDERTLLELSTARSDGEAAYADRGMDGTKFDRENLALRWRRDQITATITSLEAQLFYNYVDHVMDNYSLRPFTPTAASAGGSVSNPDRLTTGGRVQFDLAAGADLRVTAGADLQANQHTVRSTSDQAAQPFTARPRAQDARFQQAGAFVELTRTLNDHHRILAGARLDRWRAWDDRSVVPLGMSGSLPNPTAGTGRAQTLGSGFIRLESELPATATTLFAGIGRAERFPDYWELIRPESNDSTSAFARSAERTNQIDAGLHRRSGGMEFSFSVFASQIDDFILVQSGVTKPAGGMMGTRTATITRNINATTVGGEAGWSWRPGPRWKLDASVAHVHGTNRTDDRPLAQLPPLEGRLALAYLAPQWSVGALFRAVAAQDRFALQQGNIVGQDIGPSAGFGVLSLNAAWQPFPAMRWSAGIDNAFDRTYAEHISRAGAAVSGFVQTTRINEPGRLLWLKAELRY